MTPSRVAQARALLAEHQQAREMSLSLARSFGPDGLAQRFGLPNADLANRLVKSPRMAARLGQRVALDSAMPGRACPPALLPWLDAKSTHDTSIRIGLAMCLGACKGSLIRSEIAALETLYGEDAVIFAFAAQPELGKAAQVDPINPLVLHDRAKVKKAGASALMAWLGSRHGNQAAWVAHLFQGAEQAQIPVTTTQNLLDLSQELQSQEMKSQVRQ